MEVASSEKETLLVRLRDRAPLTLTDFDIVGSSVGDLVTDRESADSARTSRHTARSAENSCCRGMNEEGGAGDRLTTRTETLCRAVHVNMHQRMNCSGTEQVGKQRK